MKKHILTYFIVFLSITSSFATHIVGGELYYQSLGGDQYKIILKVYRDCLNGVAPFDNPASIGVFNSSGSLIDEILLSNPTITNLPIIVTNPCLQVPPVICTEEGIYEKTVTLNIPNGGLDLVYQRCCRNNIIQNIVTPQDMGSTWVSHIPDPSLAVDNNSAHFINVPPLLLCNEDNLVFDHSAIDPDGDVLVYEMCTPLHGANNINPMPQPPNGGPYVNISWSGGYGVTHQINGTTNLQINSSTGELICTPTTNGVFVVGICVKEYRNGVLINTTLRDFQFTVVSCSSNIISAVPNQTVLCDGYTMEFQNNSTNSSFYHWDFGDESTNADTSILIEPSYTYPDTGNYEVTLIANPGWPCADTSTATYTVQFPIHASIGSVAGQCLNGNNFDFSITGNFTPGVSFNWNFGASALPLTSTVQSPTGISYGNYGVYNVVSSVSDRGCQKDFTQQVEVYEEPVANIVAIDTCESLTVDAINASTSSISYFWNFGNPNTLEDTSILTSPSYTYPASGSYPVTMIAYSTHCSDTTTTTYKVKAPINPAISVNELNQCLTGNSYDFNLSGDYTTGAAFLWNFGSPTTSPIGSENIENPQNVEYLVIGEHIVDLTIEDEGCIKDTTILIDVKEEPIANFLDVDTCESLTVDVTNLSTVANTYLWDFGNGTNSTEENPSVTYIANGSSPITLIAYNDFCSDTTQGVFKVKDSIKPSFVMNLNPQCITGNSFDFNLSGNYTTAATFNWDFTSIAIPTTSVNENPNGVVFSSEGYHLVAVGVTDEGCSVLYSDTAKVFPSPTIKFAILDTLGCMPLVVRFRDSSIAWGDVDYLWDFGDGTTSTQHNPNHTYINSGSYDVSFSLTTNEGCLSTLTDIKLDSIFVAPRPVANFSVSPENTSIYFPEVEITDLSQGEVTILNYTIEGNVLNEANTTYSLVGMGSIPILQTIENSYGCDDTITKYVKVKPDDVLYVPNTFTPNNDGINDYFKPIAYGLKKYKFYVFNRWGDIIYDGDSSSIGWDGTEKGKLVQEGAYIWKIKFKNHQNKSDIKVGHVIVYR